jgi:FAD synthase
MPLIVIVDVHCHLLGKDKEDRLVIGSQFRFGKHFRTAEAMYLIHRIHGIQLSLLDASCKVGKIEYKSARCCRYIKTGTISEIICDKD